MKTRTIKADKIPERQGERTGNLASVYLIRQKRKEGPTGFNIKKQTNRSGVIPAEKQRMK